MAEGTGGSGERAQWRRGVSARRWLSRNRTGQGLVVDPPMREVRPGGERLNAGRQERGTCNRW